MVDTQERLNSLLLSSPLPLLSSPHLLNCLMAALLCFRIRKRRKLTDGAE
ncbi:hypothetical protein JOB18_023146 [Solea senegalensis]|uniref:Uncharacterized protein n=1 Tax=Solea senegalensis TaxID=28829 RepID=A0AAV6S877_SOLSE|nr:hypothetical protein JOB18_023146 [Solea senegalensis]